MVVLSGRGLFRRRGQLLGEALVGVSTAGLPVSPYMAAGRIDTEVSRVPIGPN
ncbi:hypothetical protein [Mesorhizobium sp. B2-4-19]|uniref:hypothetical protein n=1 Tax=Mesorhizobium sp. B2-4-19 TaxID=2589930 RepID=UPI0015E319E7|nr:hypothetical protein [Mesorhizobium sp. B2-4-19]